MEKIKIFSLGGLNETGKNTYVIEVNDDIIIGQTPNFETKDNAIQYLTNLNFFQKPLFFCAIIW